MEQVENTLLLAHLARDGELLKEAIEKASGRQLFDNVRDPVSAFIWSVLSDTYKASGVLPTRALVDTESHLRFKQPDGLVSTIKGPVLQALDSIYSLDSSQLNQKIGRMYLDTSISEVMHINWMKRVRELTDMDAMKRFVQEVTKDVSSAGFATSSNKSKPMLELDKYLVNKNRLPTGILFLDSFIGGGLAAGELLGVLGGTGGGKTVLATQLMGESAMRKRHGMLFQYEQGTEGDISERIACYLTGESILNFRDKSPGDHTDEIRAKLKKAVDEWGRYITIVDMHGPDAGLGGPEEVIRHIEEAGKAGETPFIVGIDWLGAMVDKHIAFKGRDSKDYIHIAPNFMRAVKGYCDSRGIRLVVFHQLSTEAQGKGSRYKPQAGDAYNFKTFPFYTDIMLQIGKLDTKNNIAWLIAGKNRRGLRPEQLLRLDGEHQKFYSAAGDYTTDHTGAFVRADEPPPDVHEKKEELKKSYASQYSTL